MADDDDHIMDIFKYLSNHVYPPKSSKNDKRKIRSRAKRYKIKEQKLYWKNKVNELKEVVIDNEQKQQLMKSFHDHMGHFGRERTYNGI